VDIDQNEPEEISPELKALLDERIAEHEKNPQDVVSWDEVKAKFNKKYGYAV
jgi:putative addiction module component (TIGR02574 family)